MAQLLAVVSAFGAITILVQLFAGVSLSTTILITIAVLSQILAGSSWWLLVAGRNFRSSALEILGAGTSLGTLVALLSAQIFRSTMISSWGWAVPVTATAMCYLSPKVRSRAREALSSCRPLSPKQMLAVATLLVAGSISYIPFFLRHPLRWTGYFSYYVDIPYHESLANSIQSFGASESTLLAGMETRYHWLTHAWVGSLNAWSGAESFTVLLFLVPLVSLFGTFLLAWSWASRLSSLPWVPPLTGLLLIGSGWVGILSNGGGNLNPLSPSQSFTTAWFLLFAVTLMLVIHDLMPVAVGSLGLGLIGLGLSGGKISHGVVAAGGASLVLVSSLLLPVLKHRRVRIASAAGILGTIIGYLVFVAGNDPNSLTIGVADGAARILDLEPYPSGDFPVGPIGVGLGILSLLFSLSARWFGLLGWLQKRPIQPELIYGLGVLFAGLTLAVFTTHPGGSQLYFVVSASAVLSVMAVVGLGEMLRGTAPKTSATWFLFILLAISGAAASLGFLLQAAESALGEASSLGALLGWVAPPSVWAVCIFGAILLLRLAVQQPASRSALAGLIGLLLAFSSVFAPLIADWAALARSFTIPTTSQSANAMHTDHLTAAKWLKDNSPQADIVSTNRLCSLVSDRSPDCDSRWFLTSAVSGRKMFIEGSAYSVGELAGWPRRRAELSARFARSPTVEDHEALYSAGVRWLWIDKAVVHQSDWEGVAEVQFDSDHVMVLSLRSPPLREIQPRE